jgi:hypothetical protein
MKTPPHPSFIGHVPMPIKCVKVPPFASDPRRFHIQRRTHLSTDSKSRRQRRYLWATRQEASRGIRRRLIQAAIIRRFTSQQLSSPRPRQHSRHEHGHGGPRAWRPVRLPVREPRSMQRDRAAAAGRDARVLLLHLHGLVERAVRRHRGRHGVLRVRAARHPEQSQLHPVRTCCRFSLSAS